MTKRLNALGMLLALALTAGGCAAVEAFRQGEAQMRAGNLDEAVAAYRKAVQEAPRTRTTRLRCRARDRGLARAPREGEGIRSEGSTRSGVRGYKLASEYDPSNRVATAKVAELDRTIRDRIEASRPKPPIIAMRERARAASAEPMLNPASRDPLNIHFNNTPLKDILTFLSNYTCINITYDREVTDRLTTVNLDGLTLEQALNQIMTMNQLSYKVISDRSIFVFQDTTTKHAQYDEQVVRTFYLSHADATEITQTLSTIIRLPGISVQPAIVANKTANTITVRATSSVVGILEKIIEQNATSRGRDRDRCRDSRGRSLPTKNYGLNLSECAIGAIFSPEVSPVDDHVNTG
jgi:general secretion pathway protein D